MQFTTLPNEIGRGKKAADLLVEVSDAEQLA
jgi:hypothetical protein